MAAYRFDCDKCPIYAEVTAVSWVQAKKALIKKGWGIAHDFYICRLCMIDRACKNKYKKQ